MTEQNQAIDEAVTEAEEVNEQAVNDSEDQEEVEDTEQTEGDDEDADGDEWPKKAVNALNRKNKQLNKTRASLQEKNSKIKELEAKLKSFDSPIEQKSVNADDFETMDEYLKAQMDALVENRLKQSSSENEKAQLTQEQQKLTQERDEYITTQAAEVAQVIPDFAATVQPYLQVMDNLPDQVADIFYSMENPALAAYVLAKEGKLAALQFANPYVAANEIMTAHERGKSYVDKPQKKVSQAPEPIKAVKGTGKVNKSPKQMNSDEFKKWLKT